MGYPTITTDHYRNICNLIYHSHKYIIIYPDQFDHCPPLNYPPQHRRAHPTPLPNPPPGAVRKRRELGMFNEMLMMFMLGLPH